MLTPEGNLGGKNLKKFRKLVSALSSTDRAKAVVARPELIKVVITNKIPVDFTKLNAKQTKVFKEELVKLEKDPRLPEPVKKAAKKRLEKIKTRNETNIKNPLNGNQPSDQEQGNDITGRVENANADNQPTGQSGQPDNSQVGADPSQSTQDPTKQGQNQPTTAQQQSKDSAQLATILAKPLLTPKEADQLVIEINAGNLVRPDGATKYVLGDIQAKCSIEPLIKPLLEAADPKALPDLAPIRSTIVTLQTELKDVIDTTVQGFFGDFNHADDKTVLVAHLSSGIEALEGNTLASRFALLQSVDPLTYTNEYAKKTILKNALTATPEDLVNNHGANVEQFLTTRKELIQLIGESIDVSQRITDAKAVISALDQELQNVLNQDFLTLDDAKKALDMATKTGKNVDDIKQKCDLSCFIADFLNIDDPKNTMNDDIINEVKNKVKDMRANIAALADPALKELYDSFMKNASGTFTSESEAIEACLEKGIKTVTGKKLAARCYLLNYLNKKYDKAYFRNAVLDGALTKTPEELQKFPAFRNFLSERRELIEEFNLVISSDTLEGIMAKAEMSILTDDEVEQIEEVRKIIWGGKFDAAKYLKIRAALDKGNFTFVDFEGKMLTLANVAEFCSRGIKESFNELELQRQELVNADDPYMLPPKGAQILVASVSKVKSKLETMHADIQRFFTKPDVLTREPRVIVEEMLTDGIKQLKGNHLLTRYRILKEFDPIMFDAEFATSEFIETEIIDFKWKDLNDAGNLAKLKDKEMLCSYINHEIAGEAVDTIIRKARKKLHDEFIGFDETERKSMLKTNASMLKAALLGIFSTSAAYLEQVDSQSLALVGMPHMKEAVEKAIKLQKLVDERMSKGGTDLGASSPSLSFTTAVADYLMCPDAYHFTIHDPASKKILYSDALVKMIYDSERNDFFDAVVAHDKSDIDGKLNSVYKVIKTAAHDEIIRAVESAKYDPATIKRRVEHFAKLIMMKPYYQIRPHLYPNEPATEESVELVTANYFWQKVMEALKQPNVAKTFDDSKFQSTLKLCRILVGRIYSGANDFKIALTTVETYLKDCPDFIDFNSANLKAHVPVKTLVDYSNAHPELLLKVCRDFFVIVTFMDSNTNSRKSIRSFFVHKLLVPLFAWLPTQDFAHLTKVSDEKISGCTSLASDLRIYMTDKAFKVEILNALINFSDQKSKKIMLFIWGTLKSSSSCDDQRARMDSIWTSSATNAPKEAIDKARARLLKKRKETDPALNALYKSYYEAFKTMYVPKNGEDLDQLFPNEWSTAD